MVAHWHLAKAISSLVLTLAVWFKDLKTKCIKAGKEVPKKPTGGKNKGKCTLTKAVVPPLVFRVSK